LACLPQQHAKVAHTYLRSFPLLAVAITINFSRIHNSSFFSFFAAVWSRYLVRTLSNCPPAGPIALHVILMASAEVQHIERLVLNNADNAYEAFAAVCPALTDRALPGFIDQFQLTSIRMLDSFAIHKLFGNDPAERPIAALEKVSANWSVPVCAIIAHLFGAPVTRDFWQSLRQLSRLQEDPVPAIQAVELARAQRRAAQRVGVSTAPWIVLDIRTAILIWEPLSTPAQAPASQPQSQPQQQQQEQPPAESLTQARRRLLLWTLLSDAVLSLPANPPQQQQQPPQLLQEQIVPAQIEQGRFSQDPHSSPAPFDHFDIAGPGSDEEDDDIPIVTDDNQVGADISFNLDMSSSGTNLEKRPEKRPAEAPVDGSPKRARVEYTDYHRLCSGKILNGATIFVILEAIAPAGWVVIDPLADSQTEILVEKVRGETTTNLLLPVHINENHWVLVHVNKDIEIISLFDSLESEATRASVATIFRDCLRVLMPTKEFADFSPHTPNLVQSDNENCGVAVLLQALMTITEAILPPAGIDWMVWRLLFAVFVEEITKDTPDAAQGLASDLRDEFGQYRSMPPTILAAEPAKEVDSMSHARATHAAAIAASQKLKNVPNLFAGRIVAVVGHLEWADTVWKGLLQRIRTEIQTLQTDKLRNHVNIVNSKLALSALQLTNPIPDDIQREIAGRIATLRRAKQKSDNDLAPLIRLQSAIKAVLIEIVDQICA
jgi:hypothetical protein